MVLGVLLYLKGRPHLAQEGEKDSLTTNKTLGALAIGAVSTIVVMAVVFSVGIVIALLLLIPLYFYLTRNLAREEKVRVLALVMLIPAMAVALLTNQEIFNAYLIWADQHFQLTFFGTTLPTSWMITLDATLSFSMLVAVAAFYKWYGTSAR